eukprot:RCo054773
MELSSTLFLLLLLACSLPTEESTVSTVSYPLSGQPFLVTVNNTGDGVAVYVENAADAVNGTCSTNNSLITLPLGSSTFGLSKTTGNYHLCLEIVGGNFTLLSTIRVFDYGAASFSTVSQLFPRRGLMYSTPFNITFNGQGLSAGDRFSFVETFVGHCISRNEAVVQASSLQANRTVAVISNNVLYAGDFAVCYWSNSSATPVYTQLGVISIGVIQRPYVGNISGCGQSQVSALLLCPTNGMAPITLMGMFFGASGAQVQVGSVMCTNVTHVQSFEDEMLVCTGYPGAGANASIVVFASNGMFSLPSVAVSYQPRPVVTQISGCTDFPPSTAYCPTTGLIPVTVTGLFFGKSPQVFIGGVGCLSNLTILNSTAVVCSKYTYLAIPYCLVTVLSDIGETSQETLSLVFSKIPVVTGVWGCKDNSNTTHTKRCPTNGTAPVIVQGLYFTELSMASLSMGAFPCPQFIVLNSTTIQCNLYPGSGLGNVVRVTVGGETSKQINMMLSYSPVPQVLGILGCTTVSSTSVSNCAPSGSSSITIVGINFDYFSPSGNPGDGVFVGSVSQCSNYTFQNSTAIVCTGFPGAGVNYAITVVSDGETSLNSSGVQLSYGPNCPLSGGVACAGHGVCDSVSGTCSCLCGLNNGYWMGSACDQCQPGYYGSACSLECQGGAATPCNLNGTCFSGVTGNGTCVCKTAFRGAACQYLCPTVTTSAGAVLVCSGGNNTCNSVGQCVCNGGVGSWLSNCSDCASGYYGSSCTGVCKCVRGTCNSGSQGNGSCTCEYLYTGTLCNLVCPSGTLGICSGHGACVPNGDPLTASTAVCNCSVSNSTGYWTGTLCDSCVAAWNSPYCNVSCPMSNGIPCNGSSNLCYNGGCTCVSTTTLVCGTACQLSGQTACADLVCPAGYYGVKTNSSGSCTPCPGYSSIYPLGCSGHGVCQSISGLCKCSDGYGGSTCSQTCPVLNSLPCGGSSRGTCEPATGTCTCVSGYFYGSACEVSCPGADTFSVCSQRGKCVYNGATASCNCSSGFAGTNCQLECPGGSGFPCYGHGTCSVVDASCTCQTNFDPSVYCLKCMTLWFGTYCNMTCAVPLCNGNGVCGIPTGGTTPQCICYDTDATGHWAGSACQQCASGYYGIQCTNACPGGACTPCNNNGVCNNFNNANSTSGLCTCYNDYRGHFVGSSCSLCVSGYYGTSCNSLCPGPGSPTVPCGGHGTCSDGPLGDGTCTCVAGAISGGNWGLPNCTDCSVAAYGSACTKPCPGYLSPTSACSGNGVCSSGMKGTGTCTCIGYWAGPSCNTKCLFASSYDLVPCAGHGLCNNGSSGDGSCVCTTSSTAGAWAGTLCTVCQAGYWGSSCNQQCPGGASNPCSGHGTCADGSVTLPGTGVCTCVAGYWGADCSQSCPLLSGNPYYCAKHADTCDQATGLCNCYADTTRGFWLPSSVCSTCSSGYTGAGCLDSCSTTARLVCLNSALCSLSSSSTSFSSLCSCSLYSMLCNGTAGDTASCPTVSCDICWSSGTVPKYGSNCDVECPGKTTQQGVVVACSGNGLCDAGRTGTGVCTCATGFYGTACELTCPPGGSLNIPCSGHGACQGYCVCQAGYAGKPCDIECPGVSSGKLPCYGQGVCSDTYLGDGTCSCNYGYYGSDCTGTCSPSASNPCYGHGLCSTRTGACTCYRNSTAGFWSGTACSECLSGYRGTSCTLLCIYGTTVGLTCVCTPGHYDSSCSSTCPGRLNDTTFCNGHGTCLDGTAGSGECECSDSYFGASCDQYCTREMCMKTGLLTPVCNVNGSCVCSQSAEFGYWTGDNCQVCDSYHYGENCTSSCNCNGNPCTSVSGTCKCPTDLWGQQCQNHCDCNNHGTCDQQSGQCTCYADSTNGYFTGTQCGSCASGYAGARCTQPDISITRPSASVPYYTATISDSTARSSGVLLVDSDTGVVITGSRPLVFAFQNTSITSVFRTGGYDYGGLVVSVLISARMLYVTVQPSTSTTVASTLNVTTMLIFDWPVPMKAPAGYTCTSTTKCLFDISTVRMKMPLNSAHHSLHSMSHRPSMRTLATTTTAATLAASPSFQWLGVEYQAMVFSTGFIMVMQLSQTGSNPITIFPSHPAFPITINDAVADSTKGVMYFGGGPSAWQLLAVPLSAVVGQTNWNWTSYSGSNVCFTNDSIYCSSPYTCTGVSKILVDNSSDAVILALSMMQTKLSWETADKAGIVLAKLFFNSSGNCTALNSLLVANLGSGQIPVTTVLVADWYTLNGYVFYHVQSGGSLSPSTSWRFRLSDIQAYGSSTFLSISSPDGSVIPEIVTAVTIYPYQRLLYALAPRVSVQLVPLLLFAVSGFNPSIADTRGGTNVTIIGEGFYPSIDLACQFYSAAGYSVVPAEFVDKSTLICRAPEGSDDTCDGHQIEVVVFGHATDNGERLLRAPAPNIDSVVPNRGPMWGGYLALSVRPGLPEHDLPAVPD